MPQPRCPDIPKAEQLLVDAGQPKSRFLFLFGPLPAVLIGAWVMKESGLPRGLWLQNIAVLAAMLTVAAGASKVQLFRGSRAIPWIGFSVMVITLAMTFFENGIEGVHRWITIGNFRLNAGAVCGPLLLIVAEALIRQRGFGIALIISGGPLVIFAAQPDASAAIAFAAAFPLLLRSQRPPIWQTALLLSGLGILVIWASQRPDPLGRVAYVEDIVSIAANQSAFLAAGLLLTLALIPLPFVIAGVSRDANVARSLAIYFTVSCAARLIGNFPVPFAGYGASAIIGYYLAAAWVIRQLRLGQAVSPLTPRGTPSRSAIIEAPGRG